MNAERLLQEIYDHIFDTGSKEYVGLPAGTWHLLCQYMDKVKSEVPERDGTWDDPRYYDC
jgi:hypothetical protein